MSDARQVEDFHAALARAETPDAAWAALERLARDTVGVRLFTVMTLDMEAMLARRAYTSHPAEYPTSGTKPIEPNPWFAQVAERREPFVANTLADIAQVFPDHALIGSLGCGAVVNLPVVEEGRVTGTVNLLDAEGSYTPDVAARAEAVLSRPAAAAARRARALEEH
jgi:transcriptional regulator with GAF, ATPase, and Fis domain